jgi:hypothetical protein
MRHEADYIARTIATVRNHKDADNCWPQWANIFADHIEHQAAALAVVEREREAFRERLEVLGDDGWLKAFTGELPTLEEVQAIYRRARAVSPEGEA